MIKTTTLIEVEVTATDPLAIPANAICTFCHERTASSWWSEGTIALVHGARWLICEQCVLEKQLEHARERAAAIPELEAKLKALTIK